MPTASQAPPLLHAVATRLAASAEVTAAATGDRDQLLAAEALRPFALAGLAHARASAGEHGPVVVVAPTLATAQQLFDDLTSWLGADRVAHLPAWETLPFERVSPEVETMGRRLAVISQVRGDITPDPTPSAQLVVTSVRALLQRLGPDATDPAGVSHIELTVGSVLDVSDLAEQLVEFGYRREHQVEHRGEFAVRGGIVDVFGANEAEPLRLELFGDTVERLTRFSVATQRSTAPAPAVRLFPARELRATEATTELAVTLAEREPWAAEHFWRFADGEQFDGMESWLPWLTPDEVVLPDLLGADALVVLCEPQRLVDRAADIAAEASDLAAALVRTWGVDDDSSFPHLHVPYDRLLERTSARVLTLDSPASTAPTSSSRAGALASRSWNPIAGSSAALLGQLRDLTEGPDALERVIIAADGAGSAARVAESLGREGLRFQVAGEQGSVAGRAPAGQPPASGNAAVIVAPLHHSFIAPNVGVAVLCEHDLSGRRRSHRTARRRARPQTTLEDLRAGDFVVHHQHGVARFTGIVQRQFGDTARDYMELAYKGTDRLYVPTDQLELIRPYIGGENPTLSKMGGADFRRQKEKVRRAVNEIAQELVLLYRQRLATPGHAFDAADHLMNQIAQTFEFEPTADQQGAIDAVLADMAAEAPMDRLVCGDVGFGKTEVAVRAAYCAALNGRQTAVLVPTTLLAQQHHQTFADRFADEPVRVEVLSRFLSPAQQREVISGLATGTVDVVVGTHRLLSGDVSFANLGLVVIDEEQRFGVRHKDALKQLKTDVDVLTLTATPIPRTLEMSLTGIRELSLLQTPPEERQPILTHVAPYDSGAVSEAVRRELLREGQVFFVHNRVVDIDEVAAELRQLVPEARVAVAHGQMDEGTLEQVVLDFSDGKYDVLVCTTIIESGIDMPTVNTLVVDRADLMGLGQLHQIRGRVGRSGQRAYAYLFHPPNKTLSEEAYERLRTIGESTELGSGYRIAMRDLQLRGAGNLLGGVQTGHIAAVGYDLYCELVSDALAELEGVPTQRRPSEITIDLPVQAYLPEDYITEPPQRLEAYRRLAGVTELVQVADLEAEWLDRYGKLPEPAQTLLHVGLVRTQCVRLGIASVNYITGAPAGMGGALRGGLRGGLLASDSGRSAVGRTAGGRAGVRARGVAGSALRRQHRDFTPIGRLVVSPVELSAAEDVRVRRLAADAGLIGHRIKQASDDGDTPPELQLGVAKVGPELLGQLFAVLSQLRVG